jgi:NADP-reducing hydrogenase subunit HndD
MAGDKKITLTLDGRPITAFQGETIMEAADNAGVRIPRLCRHPKLKPSSSCRLCLVEVGGSRVLASACSRPVEEGMEIATNSERVTMARRVVLELLLSDHPGDCLTCEQSGSCELQDYAYEYEVDGYRYAGERHLYPVDDANPFITRDFEKCIKCYRCGQACQEIQFCEVIDYTGRGFNTMVTSALDRPLPETDCVYCGRCVSVCPVGALTEKVSRFGGRSKDLKKTHTTCPYCGVGCSLVLETDGKRIVRVSSDEESPVNKGSLCVKGRFGFGFVDSANRLTTPLIRKDGELVPAAWDEAVKLVAEKIKATKKASGADSIAFLASSKCTNEENYVMQKFARAGVGTNNIDNCARL